MNIEYYKIYCGQRVLMFNIFNCLSVLFLKGKAIRSTALSKLAVTADRRINMEALSKPGEKAELGITF